MSFPRPLPRATPGIGLAHELTTYLMVLTGYGALIATREMGNVHTAIILAGVLFSIFRDEAARPLGALLWNGLVIGFLVFALVEWFFLPGGFVKAIVHFLGYVQLVRLLSRTGDRDTLWLQLLSFLQLTAAAILTLSMSFLLFFLLYLLVGTSSLIIFTIKREAQEAGAEVGGELLRPGFYAASAMVSVGILVVAMAVFFALPRLGTGFFGWASRGTQRVTGYGETVNLGDVGRIKVDGTTVMRVRIDGDTEPRQMIYWRGNALDSFNGKSWTSSFQGTKPIYTDGHGAFILKKEYEGEKISQEIFLEPIDSKVLFAAHQPASITLRKRGSMRQDTISRIIAILEHGSGYWSLPVEGPIQDRIRYRATSDLYRPPSDKLRSASGDASFKINYRYLQVPGMDKRLEKLASRITAGKKNNYDKTTAILEYLLENYDYSLDLPDSTPDDPLAEFLFESKAGYCEHFASAMAVMLRTQGVPTRIINGFQRGEWNSVENFYRVRQSDAHSWVEVYMGEYGWVMFDPTPADSITYKENAGFFAGIEQVLDAWRYRWNRYIVDYSFDDQRTATVQIRDRGARVGAQFGKKMSGLVKMIRKSVPRTLLAVVLILAALIGGIYFLATRLSGRERVKRVKDPAENSEARRIYIKTLRTLEKRGLPRRPGMTPIEHAGWVIKNKGPDYKSLERMAVIFGKARYSSGEAPAEDIKTMHSILNELKHLK